jgi:hypothetical protein
MSLRSPYPTKGLDEDATGVPRLGVVAEPGAEIQKTCSHNKHGFDLEAWRNKPGFERT